MTTTADVLNANHEYEAEQRRQFFAALAAPLDPPRDEDASEGDWESEGGALPSDDDDADDGGLSGPRLLRHATSIAMRHETLAAWLKRRAMAAE